MFKRVLSLALLVVLVIPAYALCQGNISGTITDSRTGEELPGANVLVEELLRGASSNLAGEFTITNIPSGEYTLRVTYVGYRIISETVNVGPAGLEVNFQMQEDFMGLDEVIVTALGIEREARSVGYAVQTLDGDRVLDAQRENVVDALAGQFSGVNITRSSGQPGRSSRIVIRGHTSMLGNNQPLFVVDGVPISNAEDDFLFAENTLFTGGSSNRGLDIDPNIVQDVTVLKGASATALYGSRAAAGAIIITTRGGQRGERPARVQFNSTIRSSEAIIDGFQTDYTGGSQGFYASGIPASRGGLSDPRPYRLVDGDTLFNPFLASGATQSSASWGPHKDELPDELTSIMDIPIGDPRKEFYQTGLAYDNSVSIGGGNQSSNYFLSFSNLQQGGIVPGTSLDRNSILTRFGTRLGERWNVNSSINYINTDNVWLAEGNSARSYLYSVNFAPINFIQKPSVYDDGTQRMHLSAFNNPHWIVDNNRYTSDVNRFIASTEVTLDVTNWLSLSERLGVDTYSDIRKEETNVGTRSRPNGAMFDQRLNRSEINSDLTLNAMFDVSEDLRINALIGNNVNMRYFNMSAQRGVELNIPEFYHVGNANVVTPYQTTEEVRMVSAYTQGTIDYRDFIYFTLTGRNDWSSTLPENNRSYFYPSASVGFIFTEALEPLRDNAILSYGKLRASIARIGDDAPVYSTATTYLQANPTDGVRGEINYPFRGVNGFRLSSSLGNPDLRPEISTEWELGMETQLFGGRGSFDLAYYNRTINDQIFNVPVSSTTGFVSLLLNAGEIQNYGFEVDLGYSPIQTTDFRWDLQGNFSNPHTKVVSLAEGVESIYLAGFTDPQVRIMPDDEDGNSGYGVIWSNRFLRNDDGDVLIGDDGYPLLAPDSGPIGNVQPDWLANFRSSFNYRGIGLSGLIDIRQGGDILNFDLYYTTFYGTAERTATRGDTYVYKGIVESTGEPNEQEIVRDQAYYQNFHGNIFENFVEDGSYVRLRELTLSYSLPVSILQSLPLQSLVLSATATNLWISTDFSYGDPDGSIYGSGNGQGFYHMVTPNARTFSFSIRLAL